MIVGAVAALIVAGPNGIATTPTGAALVVLQMRSHIVVDSPGLVAVSTQSLRCLECNLGDPALQRDHLVWLAEARQMARVFVCGSRVALAGGAVDVLAPRDRERHGNRRTVGERCLRLEI